MLATLAQEYCSALNDNQTPTIQSAWDRVAAQQVCPFENDRKRLGGERPHVEDMVLDSSSLTHPAHPPHAPNTSPILSWLPPSPFFPCLQCEDAVEAAVSAYQAELAKTCPPPMPGGTCVAPVTSETLEFAHRAAYKLASALFQREAVQVNYV